MCWRCTEDTVWLPTLTLTHFLFLYMSTPESELKKNQFSLRICVFKIYVIVRNFIDLLYCVLFPYRNSFCFELYYNLYIDFFHCSFIGKPFSMEKPCTQYNKWRVTEFPSSRAGNICPPAVSPPASFLKFTDGFCSPNWMCPSFASECDFWVYLQKVLYS